MVMVLLAQDAVTPAGKPVGVPIPVVRSVVWVILVNTLLIQTVGKLDGEVAVGREIL